MKQEKREVLISVYIFNGTAREKEETRCYFHKWGKTVYKDKIISAGIVEDINTGKVYMVPADSIQFVVSKTINL